MSTRYTKDPDAVLDFTFDWSEWLADGETISSHTVTVSGVTRDSSTNTTTTVTAWISGGTVSAPATVACRVTTSAGRTDERTISLRISQR